MSVSHSKACKASLTKVEVTKVPFQINAMERPSKTASDSKRNTSNDATTESTLAQIGGDRVSEVRATDVLVGRGAANNKHPGNVAFRETIRTLKESYQKTSAPKLKHEIALKVIRAVEQSNGRFLKMIQTTASEKDTASDSKCSALWRIMSFDDEDVIEKAKQALREKDHTVKDTEHTTSRSHSSHACLSTAVNVHPRMALESLPHLSKAEADRTEEMIADVRRRLQNDPMAQWMSATQRPPFTGTLELDGAQLCIVPPRQPLPLPLEILAELLPRDLDQQGPDPRLFSSTASHQPSTESIWGILGSTNRESWTSMLSSAGHRQGHDATSNTLSTSLLAQAPPLGESLTERIHPFDVETWACRRPTIFPTNQYVSAATRAPSTPYEQVPRWSSPSVSTVPALLRSPLSPQPAQPNEVSPDWLALYRTLMLNQRDSSAFEIDAGTAQPSFAGAAVPPVEGTSIHPARAGAPSNDSIAAATSYRQILALPTQPEDPDSAVPLFKRRRPN